jgi:hypothetical protein
MTPALLLLFAQAVAPEPPPIPRHRVFFGGAGEGVAMSLDGIPTYAGGFGIVLGGETPRMRWSIDVAGLLGRTEHGLQLRLLRQVAGAELRLGRFAPGFGVIADVGWITRVTSSHVGAITGWGLEARASFDVVSSPIAAVFVSLRPFFSGLSESGWGWGASFVVGVRPGL